VQQRVEHWILGDEAVSGYFRGVVAIYPSKGVCIKNTWLHPDGDEEPIELKTPKRLYRRLCEVIGNIHDNPELLGQGEGGEGGWLNTSTATSKPSVATP